MDVAEEMEQHVAESGHPMVSTEPAANSTVLLQMSALQASCVASSCLKPRQVYYETLVLFIIPTMRDVRLQPSVNRVFSYLV